MRLAQHSVGSGRGVRVLFRLNMIWGYKLVCSLSRLVKTTAYDIRRSSERKHYLFVKAES